MQRANGSLFSQSDPLYRGLGRTDPRGITCYADILQDLDRGLEEHLAHELVHFLDTSDRLSDTEEWNQLVFPYLQHFRATHSYFGDAFWQRVEPDAARFGLPSSFAARSTEEALAEYTTAMVLGNWNPPDGIKAFINEKILRQPSSINVEQDLLQEAYAYLQNGNYQKSIALYTKVLRSNGVCVPAWLFLGIAWTNCAEPELGIFYARETMKLLRHNGVASYSDDFKVCLECLANAYCLRAKCNLKAERYHEAIDDYTQAISFDPGNAQAYGERALAYNALGQHRKVIDDLTKAIKLDRKCAAYYNNRGSAYSFLGEYRRAIGDFTTCISLDRNNAIAYANRADHFNVLGNYRKAIDDSNKAIHFAPTDANNYRTRATAYSNLGQQLKAIEDYSKALSIIPKWAEVYNYRGNSYVSLGQYKSALADYNRSISVNPTLGFVYYNRARIYDVLGQYRKAIDESDKAINLDPKDACSYDVRGYAYAHLRQHRSAFDDFSKAISLDPHFALAFAPRALVDERLGKLELAAKDTKMAKERGGRKSH